VDAMVLDLTAYDLILGMNCLEQHRPMTYDWLMKWVEFDYQGSRVRLQGILPAQVTTMQEISGEQLHKLAKGNDIWAMVVVLSVPSEDPLQEQYLVQGVPSEIQHVIHVNSDMFEVPHSLPPSSVFDHGISLYPDSTPVNCKPYRYSPL
jgi:hypothetical protein